MDVLRTFPTDGLEQDHRFDQLSFGEATLAFAQRKIGGDQTGDGQGTVNAGDSQKSRLGAGRLVQGPLVQDEGGLVKQRQARRHEMTYRKSIGFGQQKNAFLSTFFEKSEN